MNKNIGISNSNNNGSNSDTKRFKFVSLKCWMGSEESCDENEGRTRPVIQLNRNFLFNSVRFISSFSFIVSRSMPMPCSLSLSLTFSVCVLCPTNHKMSVECLFKREPNRYGNEFNEKRRKSFPSWISMLLLFFLTPNRHRHLIRSIPFKPNIQSKGNCNPNELNKKNSNLFRTDTHSQPIKEKEKRRER